jgi:hypothetical protein
MSKLLFVGRLFLAMFVIAYVVVTELRYEELGNALNLTYDGPSCAPVGTLRSVAVECLRSRGYTVEETGEGSQELAKPTGLVSGPRSYALFIDFDPSGRVVKARLNSAVGAF